MCSRGIITLHRHLHAGGPPAPRHLASLVVADAFAAGVIGRGDAIA